VSQFTVIAGRIRCRTFEPAKIRGTISEMRLGIQWPGEESGTVRYPTNTGSFPLSRPLEGERPPRTAPTTGIAGCGARAASGHAATPQRSMMKSRRLAGRQKSIVRGNGRSVMTVSPSQPEARSGAPMAYVVLRRQTKEAVGIDGQRTGTARPLPLWRLPSGPDSPPINPIFGSGISPQARTAGHLTFQPLVRFRARCNLPFARSTLPSSVARLLHTAG
jgi:hypothetical protein